MLGRLAYTLKQSLKQITRNKAMTFASVFAIVAMLMILGVFLIIVMNVNQAMTSIKHDYDNIEVFYLNKTEMKEIDKAKKEISSWTNVKNVTYRSKEEAMKILKKGWGKNGYLLDSIKENPLPRSLIITVKNVEKSDEIASKAKSLKGIEDVKYYKDTVDKLVRFTNGVKIAAIIIIAFLILISVVVVSNTIKLTVLNRAEEISIMKYVGATNRFIRGPFLCEGIIIGGFSALISAGSVALIYSRVMSKLGSGIVEILSVPMVTVKTMVPILLFVFLVLGVIIGAWGSMISMRRFLDL